MRKSYHFLVAMIRPMSGLECEVQALSAVRGWVETSFAKMAWDFYSHD